MAIYKRIYSAYSGRLTGRWSRWAILTRYSCSRLFASKFVVLFVALSLCYPLGCLAFIYLSHNAAFMSLINFRGGSLLQIDGRFFYHFCVIQGVMACLLTAFVAPSLVSPDLVNGGLPLYLCRPLSRGEYVLGKLAVLMLLLSLVTWIPGAVLFVIQCTLAGWDWAGANLWLAWAIFFGLLIWIMVLSLIGLALSAWVRWKIAAGALVLGIFFGGAGFGTAINRVMRTSYGALIDLREAMHTIWSDLFRYDSGVDLALTDAWLVLAVVCVICLALLAKRIRAFEVVK